MLILLFSHLLTCYLFLCCSPLFTASHVRRVRRAEISIHAMWAGCLPVHCVIWKAQALLHMWWGRTLKSNKVYFVVPSTYRHTLINEQSVCTVCVSIGPEHWALGSEEPDAAPLPEARWVAGGGWGWPRVAKGSGNGRRSAFRWDFWEHRSHFLGWDSEFRCRSQKKIRYFSFGNGESRKRVFAVFYLSSDPFATWQLRWFGIYWFNLHVFFLNPPLK